MLLRESYRDNGKVKTRTLANLSRWSPDKVEQLRRVLMNQPPKAKLQESFDITRSLGHGHVAAVFGTIANLGLDTLIDPVPSWPAGESGGTNGLRGVARWPAAPRARDDVKVCY
jgi:hypothetical protein